MLSVGWFDGNEDGIDGTSPCVTRQYSLDCVIRYNEAYYGGETPLVSDSQYDALFVELQQLESRHAELWSPTSPTETVAYKVGIPIIIILHENGPNRFAGDYKRSRTSPSNDLVAKFI